jgi:hypothetical protein
LKLGKEAIMQIQVVNWVKQKAKVPVVHVANQRRTSPQAGALLKKMGVTAGFPDLFFPKSNDTHKDLYIELKVPGGKLSPHQKKFIAERMDEGSAVFVCYSFMEAVLVIKGFYRLE